jgi:hypothetical protein
VVDEDREVMKEGQITEARHGHVLIQSVVWANRAMYIFNYVHAVSTIGVRLHSENSS